MIKFTSFIQNIVLKFMKKISINFNNLMLEEKVLTTKF